MSEKVFCKYLIPLQVVRRLRQGKARETNEQVAVEKSGQTGADIGCLVVQP